jgi:hypothetical protein
MYASLNAVYTPTGGGGGCMRVQSPGNKHIKPHDGGTAKRRKHEERDRMEGGKT